MEIQMGVNQKMKLYNVYRLCKKYIGFFKIIEIVESVELNASGTKKIKIYTMRYLI